MCEKQIAARMCENIYSASVKRFTTFCTQQRKPGSSWNQNKQRPCFTARTCDRYSMSRIVVSQISLLYCEYTNLILDKFNFILATYASCRSEKNPLSGRTAHPLENMRTKMGS